MEHGLLILSQTTAPAAGPWYSQQVLDNALWQWAALLGVLLLTLLAGRIASFLLARQAAWISRRFGWASLSLVLQSASMPAGLLIFAIGLYVGGSLLDLSAVAIPTAEGHAKVLDVWGFWKSVCQTFGALAVGWFFFRLVDVLEAWIRRWAARTPNTLDDQLVPIIRKSLRVFIVIVLGLFIAQNIFHWDIGALLAGLGLGGLAVALAAQHALKNFFGSVAIFADRPFAVGDFVKVPPYLGTIEEVGFRSTRLRTLGHHVVTLPNALVADSAVENLSRRGFIRRELNVTITYDTPPAKVARAVEILRQMLAARQAHLHGEQPSRVFFNDFNAASLNLLVVYAFVPADWWACQQFNHDFNLELLRRFNDEGIEFAFPTQTLYLKPAPPAEAGPS